MITKEILSLHSYEYCDPMGATGDYFCTGYYQKITEFSSEHPDLNEFNHSPYSISILFYKFHDGVEQANVQLEYDGTLLEYKAIDNWYVKDVEDFCHESISSLLITLKKLKLVNV